MKKIKIIIILLIVSFCEEIQGQVPGLYPTKIPNQYIVNVKNELDSLKLDYPKVANTEIFKDFAEVTSYHKKALLLNGNVYYNFSKYEEYLNAILQRLLAASDIENKSRFRAYLKSDASYNAFAMPDGTVLVTMGLLSSCLNESALACILAHEIAHVKYHDAYKDYKKNLSIDWRNITSKDYNKIISNLNYSRGSEMRADSFGFYLAMKAGFDVKQGFSNYNYIYREELRTQMYKSASYKANPNKDIRYLPVSETAEDIKLTEEDDETPSRKNILYVESNLSTHPQTIDRVLVLKQILEEEYQEYLTNYPLISDQNNLFNELQQVAKKETLRLLLQDHKYNECIEKSFVMILKDTNDQTAIYFLLESMRRSIVQNNNYLKAGFLTKGLEKIIKKKKSILHYPMYLIPDSTLLLSYQGITFFDSAYEFENNKSAFIYFSKKADARINPEINLTRGLFNKSNGISKGDSLLRCYINDSNSLYKNYAKKYLSGELFTHLEKNTRDIVLCSDLNVFTGTKTNFKKEYILTDSATNLFELDYMKYNNKKPFGVDLYFQKNQTTMDFNFLNSLNNVLYSSYYMITNANDFKTATNERELEDDSEDSVVETKTVRKKKEKTNQTYTSYIYQLEPETWSFIDDNNIRSVSGFYISKLFDKKKQGNDIFNNISGIIIPGILFLRTSGGSRANSNLFTYLNFQTALSDKPILLQQDEAKDRFQRMDYLNALYLNLKMTKHK